MILALVLRYILQLRLFISYAILVSRSLQSCIMQCNAMQRNVADKSMVQAEGKKWIAIVQAQGF